MTSRVFAAVDLGASGGRVMAGVVDGGLTRLESVHRFPNGMQERDGHLRWDLTGLFDEVLGGLSRLTERFPQVESIGIDTWGVDYGLLDEDGQLIAEPIAYRDDRTGAAVDAVHRVVSPAELYAINGLQFLPFTTIYQLAAERGSPRWERAAHVVLLPDLIAYWLTGELAAEATNASTTGLLDVRSRAWSRELLDRLEIPGGRLPRVEYPGQVRGTVRSDLAARLGLPAGTVVTTIGSHDTASAVVAVPAAGERYAYIASGTWSLVGLELDRPVLSDESRTANFTNEGGVDGRHRFLRNVGGLWLLQECLRSWADLGEDEPSLDGLLADAEALGPGGPTIDVDDPAFMAPGRMPERIVDAAAARDQPPPATRAAIVRCILDSLARAYADTLRGAVALAGHPVDVVHVVGGGSQNQLLCQLTADETGLPVAAGPVEATALGNVIVQARAHGALPASLEELRARVAETEAIRHYRPRARSERT